MIEKLYNEWCKETKRNGAILIGGSMREFFIWLKDKGYTLHHDSNNIYPHESHFKEIEHIKEIA